MSGGQIKQVRGCFFKALGKCELGLFRKSRTEANEAGASKRGKWLETRSGRQQGQDQLLIHSTLKDMVDLGFSSTPPNLVEINWPERCLKPFRRIPGDT